MFYYVLEICASLAFALGFCATKFFQKFTRNNFISAVLFLLITSIISAVIFFFINGLRLSFEPLTFILALIMSVIFVFYSYIAILILKYGSLSTFSQFMMLGGMIIPYFFGVIAFNEALTDLKIVGLLILILSLCLTIKIDKIDDKKKTTIYITLCILAFLINGTVSVLSAIQGNATIKWGIPTTPTYDFFIWRYLTSIVMCIPIVIVMLLIKNKREDCINSIKETTSLKPLIGVLLYAVINNVGAFLQLYCIPFVESSILFPISTGGTIAFSTLLGWILYKEKANKMTIICLILTVISTIIFMLGDFFSNTYIIDFFKNLFN